MTWRRRWARRISLQRRGCLYLYETEAAFRAAEADMALRRTLGVDVTMLIARRGRAGRNRGCPRWKAGPRCFPGPCSSTIPA